MCEEREKKPTAQEFVESLGGEEWQGEEFDEVTEVKTEENI